MSNSPRIPNWRYWGNQPLWTLDEAYALCEGMEPNATFLACDVEIVSMVEKAIASNELPAVKIPQKSRLEKGVVLSKQNSGFAIKPSEFIAWAKMRKIHLNEELVNSINNVDTGTTVESNSTPPLQEFFPTTKSVDITTDLYPKKSKIDNLSTPQEMIIALRNQGLDDKAITKELDEHFPGISDANLGEILPVDPSRSYSKDGLRTRGQRLRNKRK